MASMPELVTNRLTFAVVMSIFDRLIGVRRAPGLRRA